MYKINYQDRTIMKNYEIEVNTREEADTEAIVLEREGYENIIISKE